MRSSESKNEQTGPKQEGTSAGRGFRRGLGLGLCLGVLGTIALLITLSWPLLSSCSGDSSTGKAGSDPGGDQGGAESVATDPKLANLVIARVGRSEIRVKDLDWKIKIQFSSMQELKGLAAIKQKREVLRAMVDQYCWVTVAEQKGYDKDRDFLDVLELSRKYILANHSANREVYTKIHVTDADIEKYYEDNIDTYQTVARSQAGMVVLRTRAEAEKVRARLVAGENLAALAPLSIDNNTRLAEGRIGTVTTRSTISGFEDYNPLNLEIMKLGVNQVSAPIETPHGFCVVKVTDVIPAGVQALEDVKADIQKKLELKANNELFTKVLTKVRDDLHAGIDEKGWDEYTYSFLGETDLLQLAQTDQNPEDRIRHYQALIERYPAGARAAQALFMIGFTWADELKEYGKAREAFQLYLSRYPQGELAGSARWMLDNMEKGLDGVPEAEAIKRQVGSR
ncbi:MAG: peptidyl-prolyl cis-trans isomerase [Candidatus Eisenbacteria bacterium]